MRFLSISLLALCCFACGPEVPPDATVTTDETTAQETNDLTLGLLDDFPDYVIESGCDCTLQLEDGSAEDLFFVFDQQGKGSGVMRINGEDVVVERSASLKTNNDKYDSYLHQNETWIIKTSFTKKGPAGDESNSFTGKVKISNRQTGVKTEVRVKGLCSC